MRGRTGVGLETAVYEAIAGVATRQKGRKMGKAGYFEVLHARSCSRGSRFEFLKGLMIIEGFLGRW